MVAWKDRTMAVLVPLISMVVSVVLPYISFLVPLACYFIAKRLGSMFAANYALRYFDLYISFFIYAFLFVFIHFSLGVVAKDGGFTIPLVSSGLLLNIVIILATIYGFIATALFIVFPLLGREFRMPLSLKIFEALRGKSSNKSSQQDTSKTGASA